MIGSGSQYIQRLITEFTEDATNSQIEATRKKNILSLHLVVKTIESQGNLGNQLLAFSLCIA